MDVWSVEVETSGRRKSKWVCLRGAAASKAGASLLILLVIAALVANRDTVFDRIFVFFPERELQGDPSDVGLAFTEVSFPATDGVMLHGWLVPGPREITWLWFHGNAGNISHRLDNLLRIHHRLGVNVFLFDYRGYGRSEGRPSEKGTYADAEGAFRHLTSRPDVDSNKIVLFGRSLGCALAVDLATRHEPNGLILESPFTSVADLANRAIPFLPLGFLVRTKYNSLSKIGNVSVPLLVLHGNADEVVPLELATRLFEAANQPKTFYTIVGAGHNNTYAVGGEPYFAALDRIMESLR